MKQDKHKQVSADVPFSFLNAMGHDTRAMERFFELPHETRETLTDAVCVSDDPDTRTEQALKSLAHAAKATATDTEKQKKRPVGRFSAFCSVFTSYSTFFTV